MMGMDVNHGSGSMYGSATTAPDTCLVVDDEDEQAKEPESHSDSNEAKWKTCDW